MSNTWQEMIDADLTQAKPEFVPIKDGLYNTLLADATPMVFRTGSKGVEVKFVIQDEGEFQGRWIFEKFVTELASGAPNRVGITFLKQLIVAGMTPEQASKFRKPNFKEGLKGDFIKLIEQPFKVTTVNKVETKGAYAGKSKTRISSISKA
jgi:hypothetical protein